MSILIRKEDLEAMARKLKECENLNCKIDKGIADRLDAFIQKTQMSKTATVERALKLYLDRHDATGEV